MGSIEQNAHIIAYIIKTYPENTFDETLGILQMPEIDINTGIWFAEDQGILKVEGGKITFIKDPKTWNFGQEVIDLRDKILYGFGKLATVESDFEQNSLAQWMQGYAPRFSVVVLERLVEEGFIAKYTIKDDVQNDGSEYTFYTLSDNRDKEWGRKQFKKKPMSKATEGKKVDKTKH